MEFEKLLKELQDIVDRLDDPKTGLDEGLALFDRGIKVSKECLKVLTETRGKVELLKKELDGLTLTTFDVENDQ
jgi:exodeoxyribonuclease VII small subunit